jgi:hypothetical protein
MQPIGQASGEITIKVLGAEQREEVIRLAQLDSSPVPDGVLLGAALDGRLVAVISVTSGQSIADPFVRTEELRELLHERATQLNGGDHRRGLRRLLRRGSRATTGELELGLGAFAGCQVGAEGEPC